MRDEKIRAVVTFDPAIDTQRMSQDQLYEYARTRDFKRIEKYLKPNEATIYNIREIPRSLFVQVLVFNDEASRGREAFRLGVESVENLYQDDGVKLERWKGTGSESTKDGNVTVISREELDRFSPAEVHEIGMAAFWHSFLPRRIALNFRLPLLSFDILTLREYLSADASPTDASLSSSKPSDREAATGQSPGETASVTVKPGDESGVATGASAEASAS